MTSFSATPAAAAAATTAKKDHVLIFPFQAKGHTLPLLHLATVLASQDILVTLITTPANVTFLQCHLSSIANIRLLLLPFPHHPDLPIGVESTHTLPSLSLFPAFVAATTLLHDPFFRLLHRLLRSPTPPLCLISDFFLGWTLPLCRRFHLPRLVFHGMSPFSMSLCKSLWLNLPASHADSFPVPGAPPSLRLAMADVPAAVRNSADSLNPETQFLNEIGATDVGSWGVIVNSFAELESPAYVELLESFYRKSGGGRVWLVGPLCRLDGGESGSECVRWLDRQPAGSVVYVAFGTQASVSEEQLEEVAHGLMRAGVRFLWAVRSETWVPPAGLEDLGRIERGWVPQDEVLRRVAVGGFVSHCGWNSVLEAAVAGVPVVALPMIAEQHLNAKMVEEELGIGVRMPAAEGVVGREAVEEGVREIMGGEKGRKARERAAELAAKAKAAVVEGGSSYRTREELLKELRKVRAAVMEEGAVKLGDQDGAEICDANYMEGEGEVELEVKVVQWEWHDGIHIAQ